MGKKIVKKNVFFFFQIWKHQRKSAMRKKHAFVLSLFDFITLCSVFVSSFIAEDCVFVCFLYLCVVLFVILFIWFWFCIVCRVPISEYLIFVIVIFVRFYFVLYQLHVIYFIVSCFYLSALHEYFQFRNTNDAIFFFLFSFFVAK